MPAFSLISLEVFSRLRDKRWDRDEGDYPLWVRAIWCVTTTIIPIVLVLYHLYEVI
jgi:choline-glycine betaine transporter